MSYVVAGDGETYQPEASGTVNWLGYVGMPGAQGAARVWTAADWANAKANAASVAGGFLAPIVVPPIGTTPQAAASALTGAAFALGMPRGCIVVLDHEAGRTDLTATWVADFVAACRTAGCPVMGYGSASDDTLASCDYRWLAEPGWSPAQAEVYLTQNPGVAAVQYLWAQSYDLSVVREGLPFWTPGKTTTTPPPAKKAPTVSLPKLVLAVKPASPKKDFPVAPGTVWVLWPDGTKSWIVQPQTLPAAAALFGQSDDPGTWPKFDVWTLERIPTK